MNEAPANPPLEVAESPRDDQGWSGRRLIFLGVLFLAGHLVLIGFLGTKKQNVARTLNSVPQWQMAEIGNEFIALNDPTLFALPHANDFATRFWNRTPTIAPPDFRWTEAPRWLPLSREGLGAAFREFVQTNDFVGTPLDFKPSPKLDAPALSQETVLPQFSTLQISGALASRRAIQNVTVPTLLFNDVIAPSRLQAVVEPDGNIVSVVLLESSGYSEADQIALRLGRAVRFAPAPKVSIGELIFKWHTVATNAINPDENH